VGRSRCAAACRFGSSGKRVNKAVNLDAGLDRRGDSHRCTYHLPNYQALQESRFERPSHGRWLYRGGLINGWVRPICDSAGFAAQHGDELLLVGNRPSSVQRLAISRSRPSLGSTQRRSISLAFDQHLQATSDSRAGDLGQRQRLERRGTTNVPARPAREGAKWRPVIWGKPHRHQMAACEPRPGRSASRVRFNQ
jgi:hypothetical protein